MNDHRDQKNDHRDQKNDRRDQENDHRPPRSGASEDDPPISPIQRFYDNIWLWAVLAVIFWAVSYLGWGYLDLIMLEAG